MKKHWYQKWWIWLIAVCVAVSIPFVINETYKHGTGYVTLWDAADMLSFYGSFLSFFGTIVLGFIAINQSNQANRLSERMLKLEESQELPIVDVLEIMELPNQLPTNKYNNSLHLYLNNSNFSFHEDNTIDFSDDAVALFSLANICSNQIISLAIEDVSLTTIYSNGKCIKSTIDEFSINGGIRVLASNESQYFFVGGAHHESPDSLTEQEILDQNYTNPTIELTLAFQLVNTRGRKFRERIMVKYALIGNIAGISYPCILAKEILSIEEE